MPPTNIEASACTRQMTSSGLNHRSPGESQMTRARSAASSPATLLRSEEASVRRAVDSSGTASSAAAGRERVVRTHPLKYDVTSPDARVRRRLRDAYLCARTANTGVTRGTIA